MSGYLNTLAARQLGVAEIIRPRLSARFEPPHAAEAALTAAFAPAEQPQAMSPTADSGFDSPPPRQAGFSSVQHPPELLQPKEVFTPGLHPWVPPPRVEASQEEGERQLRIADDGLPIERLFHSTFHNPKSPIERGERESQREPQGGTANLPGMQERAVSLQQESLTRRQAEAVTASSVRPVIPTTIVVQPRVTRSGEPQAPPLAESPAVTQSTPTIQVTIGRIEVRATPPSTQAPRPRPTQPVMSLDEYLNQRRRGQR